MISAALDHLAAHKLYVLKKLSKIAERITSGLQTSSEDIPELIMLKQNKQLYEFGPFRLDADRRLLMRDGRMTPLPPKVFDTLLVLVENSGRVVIRMS